MKTSKMVHFGKVHTFRDTQACKKSFACLEHYSLRLLLFSQRTLNIVIIRCFRWVHRMFKIWTTRWALSMSRVYRQHLHRSPKLFNSQQQIACSMYFVSATDNKSIKMTLIQQTYLFLVMTSQVPHLEEHELSYHAKS